MKEGLQVFVLLILFMSTASEKVGNDTEVQDFDEIFADSRTSCMDLMASYFMCPTTKRKKSNADPPNPTKRPSRLTHSFPHSWSRLIGDFDVSRLETNGRQTKQLSHSGKEGQPKSKPGKNFVGILKDPKSGTEKLVNVSVSDLNPDSLAQEAIRETVLSKIITNALAPQNSNKLLHDSLLLPMKHKQNLLSIEPVGPIGAPNWRTYRQRDEEMFSELEPAKPRNSIEDSEERFWKFGPFFNHNSKRLGRREATNRVPKIISILVNNRGKN